MGNIFSGISSSSENSSTSSIGSCILCAVCICCIMCGPSLMSGVSGLASAIPKGKRRGGGFLDLTLSDLSTSYDLSSSIDS